MNETGKQVLGIVAIIVVTSAVGLLVFSGTLNLKTEDFVSTIRVPGIVEGTAQMIDTQSYFTKEAIASAKASIDLRCNDSDYIQMTIGYKEATNALMDVQHPVKEIEIWSGGNKFQTKSVDRSTSRNEIKTAWDLLEIGFTETDYVKANERIWYLKIVDTRDGPFGYERNITIEENGELLTLPDFVPNINYIESFQISFNGLTFETMLHPFFDGSKEVVIPIRGVNHELTKESYETFYRSNNGKGTWSTTIPSGSDNNKWAIVFGTAEYDSGLLDDLFYPPMECRGFIQGIEKVGAPSEFDAGILDYGWRVAYCMDGSSQQTDMATTTKTDDGYLEKMFDKIDDWQGSGGKCIVFVASHGVKYASTHRTITGNSNLVILAWSNTVSLSEYKTKIESITDDGTHVLLWASACHGDGLDEFMGEYSHNRLETWSFRPYHCGVPSNGEIHLRYADDYHDFYWLYDYTSSGALIGNSEAALFFIGADAGPYQKTVSYLGINKIKPYYDSVFNNDDWDYSKMYIQMTWGTYAFYVNTG